MSVEELRRELNLENYPYIEAETIRGVGVVETFELISRESLKNFVKKAGLSDFLCSV